MVDNEGDNARNKESPNEKNDRLSTTRETIMVDLV